MRFSILALSALAFLAACERQAVEPDAPAPAVPVIAADVTVSDELPGLSAPATGITFWDHPALAFNSLLIVASDNGIVSYNVEDGNEVSRIPGIRAKGAAVSYIGHGSLAAGVLAIFDVDDSAFKFYGVGNASRAFQPVEGGPVIRGNVRGFCFGRAVDGDAPALFVVQKSKLSIFNFEKAAGGLVAAGETALQMPDDIAACTVDIDGVVLAASESGAIFRVVGGDSFSAPFARAEISNAGEMAVLAFESTEDDEVSVHGQIMLLDRDTGALHLFDRSDGQALGVISVTASDELEGVSAASAMGATAGNLGGLYRNGVIALGVDGADSPAIRLAPVNGVMNALSLPDGDPISPRGAVPAIEDDALIIELDFQPQ